MRRELPPLNSLRAFESAARHLSFQKAADELHVTPAAISHQIKGLEDRLGAPLFRRMTRALALTEAGKASLPFIGDGLDFLADGWRRMRIDDGAGFLTVSVSPTIAANWIVPRLPTFTDRYPDVRVRMDTTLGLADFDRDGVDIAVRFGPGGYPDLVSECLISEEIIAVCCPDLMEGPHPIREQADLRHHNLLHTDWDSAVPQPDWRMWLTTAGVVDQVDWRRGPVFTLHAVALAAAMEGQGVTLSSRFIVEEQLKSGELVAPFDISLRSSFDYWIVYPPRNLNRTKVRAFRDWLLEESKTTAGGFCELSEAKALR